MILTVRIETPRGLNKIGWKPVHCLCSRLPTITTPYIDFIDKDGNKTKYKHNHEHEGGHNHGTS
jgi:hypothetical protein